MQTIFRFLPHSIYSGRIILLLERGVHKPSPAEFMAPFRQDPTQRIVVLLLDTHPHYLIVRVGALLKLLGNREGTEIGWDEWKAHVAIRSPPRRGPTTLGAQVSGCRLFFSTYFTHDGPEPRVQIEVHNFCLQGRAKYLGKRKNGELGEVGHLSSTGAIVRMGPPGPGRSIIRLLSGDESIVLSLVSTTAFVSFWDGAKHGLAYRFPVAS